MKYPEVILEKGIKGEEEIVFLVREMQKDKSIYKIMRATATSVIPVGEVANWLGTELPVYIKLLSSYICTGVTQIVEMVN